MGNLVENNEFVLRYSIIEKPDGGGMLKWFEATEAEWADTSLRRGYLMPAFEVHGEMIHQIVLARAGLAFEVKEGSSPFQEGSRSPSPQPCNFCKVLTSDRWSGCEQPNAPVSTCKPFNVPCCEACWCRCGEARGGNWLGFFSASLGLNMPSRQLGKTLLMDEISEAGALAKTATHSLSVSPTVEGKPGLELCCVKTRTPPLQDLSDLPELADEKPTFEDAIKHLCTEARKSLEYLDDEKFGREDLAKSLRAAVEDVETWAEAHEDPRRDGWVGSDGRP